MYSCWYCAIDRPGYEEKLMNQDDIRIFDLSALGITIGTVAEILPSIAALLSIVWMSIRIYVALKEIRDKRRD